MGTMVRRMGRREAEQFRRREYILRTATRLFSERGFHEVSMQEIAKESEIAIATLYKMFGNKEELYSALMTDMMREMQEEIERIMAEEIDERAKLEKIAIVKSGVLCRHMSTVRLFLKELRMGGACPTATLIQEIQGKVEAHARELAELFKRGIEHGIFIKNDPVVLAMGFIGLSEAALMLTSEDNERYPAEATTRAMLNIFFNKVAV